MKSMSALPVKVFGPAVLMLPMSFFSATTLGGQLAALEAAAGTPGTAQHARMKRFAAKLSK